MKEVTYTDLYGSHVSVPCMEWLEDSKCGRYSRYMINDAGDGQSVWLDNDDQEVNPYDESYEDED
jgi:hypothetical protein